MFKGKDLSGIECQSIEAFRKHVEEAYKGTDPCKLPRLALEDVTLIGCEMKGRNETVTLVTGWAYIGAYQYKFTMIIIRRMEEKPTIWLFEACPYGKAGVLYYRDGAWIFRPKDRNDERLKRVIWDAFL